MADLKISALTASTTPLAGTEVLPIVQSSTTKQVSVANLTAGRAVSASSLTTTGLVYVGTNLGVGKSPATKVDVYGTGAHESVLIKLAQGASSNYSEFQINFSGTFNLLTWGGGASPYADKTTLSGSQTLALNTNSADRISIDNAGNTTVNTGNLVIGTSGKGIDFSATSGTGTSELLADYEEGTWTPNQGAGLTVVGAFSSSGTYTKVGRQVTVSGVVTGATSINTSGSGIVCTNLPFAVATSVPVGVMTNTASNNSNVYGNPTTSTMYSSTATGVSGSLYFTLTYITS